MGFDESGKWVIWGEKEFFGAAGTCAILCAKMAFDVRYITHYGPE